MVTTLPGRKPEGLIVRWLIMKVTLEANGSGRWAVSQAQANCYLKEVFPKKGIHFFEVGCQNNPQMPYIFFLRQNNSTFLECVNLLGCRMSSFRKFIEPVLCGRHPARPRVGYRICQLADTAIKERILKCGAFQRFFPLLPHHTRQMTFLFLVQSPGHTQAYFQYEW